MTSEASDVAELLTETLVEDGQQFISRAELVELYTNLCKGRGIDSRFRIGSLIGQLITTAATLFKIHGLETRPWIEEVDHRVRSRRRRQVACAALRRPLQDQRMLWDDLQEKGFEGDPFEGCTPGTQIIDLTLEDHSVCLKWVPESTLKRWNCL